MKKAVCAEVALFYFVDVSFECVRVYVVQSEDTWFIITAKDFWRVSFLLLAYKMKNNIRV